MNKHKVIQALTIINAELSRLYDSKKPTEWLDVSSSFDKVSEFLQRENDI